MKSRYGFKITITVLLVVVAILSITVLGRYMSDPSSHADAIAELEEKEKDVLKLTAAAAGVSAVITLIPDDIGTPIADEIAEIGGYGLLVVCAIYLEKILLTLTGALAFKVLIPVACALAIVFLWSSAGAWKTFAFKIFIFAMAIWMIIPVSIRVSDLIETTYSDSISETMEAAENAQNELGTVSEVTQQIKGMINRFIKAIAIMIVTSCVIPVLVLVFFIWIVNLLFGTNIRGMDFIKWRGRKEAETVSEQDV